MRRTAYVFLFALRVPRPIRHEPWMDSLPVVRMHVAGKERSTTHFGNNLRMEPGRYDVRVTVNGEAPATFDITVGGGT